MTRTFTDWPFAKTVRLVILGMHYEVREMVTDKRTRGIDRDALY